MDHVLQASEADAFMAKLRNIKQKEAELLGKLKEEIAAVHRCTTVRELLPALGLIGELLEVTASAWGLIEGVELEANDGTEQSGAV